MVAEHVQNAVDGIDVVLKRAETVLDLAGLGEEIGALVEETKDRHLEGFDSVRRMRSDNPVLYAKQL